MLFVPPGESIAGVRTKMMAKLFLSIVNKSIRHAGCQKSLA